MGSLITYENLEDGQKVTANIFNERFAQIVAQINGKLSAVHMENAGITKEKLATEVFESIYPVGSLYVNFTDDTNPATLLGFGTWTAVAGKFVVGYDGTQTEFNAAEKTGGALTHTHALTAAWAKFSPVGNIQRIARNVVAAWSSNHRQTTSAGANESTSETFGAGLGGLTDAGSSLPPYIVGYCWKRVS